MKNLISLLLVYSLIFTSINCFGQGIQFLEGSWNDALSKAQNSNKLIFVDVYTTWCGPCKAMAKDVFPDPQVSEKFNAQFVNFKIDAEKGEGIDLAKKYQVEAYPNFLFINGTGELVYRVVGYRPAENFLQEADLALKQMSDQSMSWYEAQFEAKKKNPDFLLAYLEKLKVQNKDNAQVLGQYLSLFSPEEQLSEPMIKRLAENLNSLSGAPLELALKAYRQVSKYSIPVQHTLAPALFMLIQREASQAAKAKDRIHFDKAIAAMRSTGIPEAEETIWGMEMDFAKQSGNLVAFDQFATKIAAPAMARTDADIRKMSQEAHQNYLKAAIEQKQDTSSVELKGILSQLKNQGAFMTTLQLNQLAWAYVETMKDKTAWKKALKWSARSIEISPNDVASLDTYANLLYKTGKKKKAIQYQEKAIKVSPEDEGLKQTLEKIKQGTL